MTPDLAHELALLRDLGYTHLDLPESVSVTSAPQVTDAPVTGEAVRSTAVRLSTPSARHETSPPRNESTDSGRSGATSRTDLAASIAGVERIDELAAIAAVCTRCRLAGTRTQVVYGVGSPNADLMFIGEAPGRDEDIQGQPFVGRAGQLLTDIIKAMKLTRDDVYIANVIKCRPPENRNPEPDELDACRPFIRRQIEIIKPKVIVTLGKFALQSLTGRAYSISSVRGQWLDYEGIRVMPTYHPAYLLRTPTAKKDVWQDMKNVMSELGIAF